MAYADAANYNKIKSMKGYHVGTIIPWSGSQDSVPTGWLPCDGRSLGAPVYRLLYESIGVTYGGVVSGIGEDINGSFRLPNLNGNGIVDIYRGQFYEQDTDFDFSSVGSVRFTEAHRSIEGPSNFRVSDPNSDVFWKNVTDDKDVLLDTSNSHTSTFDLIGEYRGPLNNLSAGVSGVQLEPGEYQRIAQTSGRRLSDIHIRSHSHTLNRSDTNISTSFVPDPNNLIALCGLRNRTGSGSSFFNLGSFFGTCEFSGESCTRPSVPFSMEVRTNVSGYGLGGQLWSLHPINYRQGTGDGFQAPSASNGLPSYIPNFVSGGSSYSNGRELPGGNGSSSGDMWSHKTFTDSFPGGLIINAGGGQTDIYQQRRFQTSLNSVSTTWNQVSPHDHGPIELNFTSRLRAVSKYAYSNIELGNVTINNSTGVNAGTININSYTPTLVTMFIIRAY
jgi:microcystin-dependent protein